MAARYLVGATLTMLAGLAGCQTSRVLPEDPLFLNHKPVESKVERKPPVHLAYVNPAMPAFPQRTNDHGLAHKKLPAEQTTAPQAPGMPTNSPEPVPQDNDVPPRRPPEPEF